MNENLDRGTRSLENSRQVMDDLESSALDVSAQLRQNRETLQSAHNRLKASSGLTSQARSLLRKMENRQTRQKLIIYCVMVIVACVLLYMIYAILFRKS